MSRARGGITKHALGRASLSRSLCPPPESILISPGEVGVPVLAGCVTLGGLWAP